MVMQRVACSCCEQKTSEKYLANRISFFLDQKNYISSLSFNTVIRTL